MATKTTRSKPVNEVQPPIDLDKIYTEEKPSLTLFMGKSKSGKSYALKYLITRLTYQLKFFKFGAVFSGTAFNNGYNYIDENYVFGCFDEEIHKRYTDKLIEMKEQLGDNMPPNFIIYDDVLGQLGRSKQTDNWFSTSRHTNTYLFIANQYLSSQVSSTLVRNQTDYAFFFPEKKTLSRKIIYEWFGSHFPTYAEFEEVFEKATNAQYRCLVYNDNAHEKEQAYMGWKAPQHIPEVKLRFGGKQQTVIDTSEIKQAENSDEDEVDETVAYLKKKALTDILEDYEE